MCDTTPMNEKQAKKIQAGLRVFLLYCARNNRDPETIPVAGRPSYVRACQQYDRRFKLEVVK